MDQLFVRRAGIETLPVLALVSVLAATAATALVVLTTDSSDGSAFEKGLVALTWVGAAAAYFLGQRVVAMVLVGVAGILALATGSIEATQQTVPLITLWLLTLLALAVPHEPETKTHDLARFAVMGTAIWLGLVTLMVLVTDGPADEFDGTLVWFESFASAGVQLSIITSLGLLFGALALLRRPAIAVAIGLLIGVTQLIGHTAFYVSTDFSEYPLWTTLYALLSSSIPAAVLVIAGIAMMLRDFGHHEAEIKGEHAAPTE